MGGVTAYLLMADLIPATDAIAILRAAGVNAQKSPAPRGRCRTLCYLVAGQYVNLGRLRQLARDAMPAAAPEAIEPEPVNVDAIARNAGRAYETACLDRYADPSDPEAQYVAAMEGRRAVRAARIAATLAHANGADAAGVRVAAAAAVAELAAFDAAFASR